MSAKRYNLETTVDKSFVDGSLNSFQRALKDGKGFYLLTEGSENIPKTVFFLQFMGFFIKINNPREMFL